MTHIYIGIIPGIFGYGISVASKTKAGAMASLRKAYDEWKQARPDPETDFEKSYERWGGSITKVELDHRSYNDNFAS